MNSKKLVFLIILIIVATSATMIFTRWQYFSYVEKNNQAIANIVNQSLEGQVKEETVVQILQGKESIDKDILGDYGYSSTEMYLVSENEDELISNTIFNVLLVNLLILMFFGISVFLERKRRQEYKKIIDYMEGVRNKGYSLKIEENKEGDISYLKNELYKTTLSLRERTEQLEEDKLKLKNNLADISHQLKTPLTSIGIMLDNIIEDKEMEPEIRDDFLLDIKEKTTNIEFLIYNLLKISKFDVDVISFKKEEIIVDELIKKSLFNIEYLVKEKNLKVIYDIESQIKNGTIKGDFKWQIEAVTNILKNAAEHSSEGGVISIKVDSNKLYTVIIIEDNGRGISEEKLKKIFNRFYKDEFSNEHNVGIGLNLAKLIIQKDRGIVEVTSKLGEGTTFKIKYFA